MSENFLKKKRVTIKVVAHEAGVSTQTVSRVLNDRSDVAPDTRQRVKDVIQRLGYHPSAVARSLIQQRSYTIAVVTAGLDYLGPAQTLNGITQSAEALGYSLLLKELPDLQAESIDAVLQSLLARQVDGIIWSIPQVGDNHGWMGAILPEIAVPMLFLTVSPQTDIPSISIDNYLGGCIATQHLLDQCYRKIGHIAGPQNWWEARARKNGWDDTLAKSGISVNQDHWVEGNWSTSSGYDAGQKLLKQYPGVEAVFVANDQMALGFLKYAQEQSLSVPQDLAVVGFDGIPETAYYFPPLTTVRQDLHQLGCIAVEALIEVIEKREQEITERREPGEDTSEPGFTALQPQIIVRESSVLEKVLQVVEN
ncbi:LacI family DNA-binding transcriptional regulator [Chloroflexota bacterium]